ncbi:MAG: YceI family protein [Chitinophagaceae bacterium]|nr:YceI family protein [Chitinophagaceae bacterium]
MIKALRLAVIGLLFLSASAYTVQAILNWKIDSEKAMVKFSLQAHGQELIGNFKGVTGEVKFDEKDLTNASVSCNIDISTINTGIESRDKHLQSKGFFDAASAPFGRFISTKFEQTDNGYTVTGNLTIKQTTLEIRVPFTFNASEDSGLFKGSFTIKRSDYKVGEADDEIGDPVTIYLELPVVKTP